MPKFSEQEMKIAVQRVIEEGVSVNRVAKEHGLCQKTLKSYIEKFRSSNDLLEDMSCKPNYEMNQVFTNNLEKVLEENLLSLFRKGKAITRDIVRSTAYDFAINCNVHVPKTWNVRKQAGLDWMYGFLNRHHQVKEKLARNRRFKCGEEEEEEEESLEFQPVSKKKRLPSSSNAEKKDEDEDQNCEVLGIEDIRIENDLTSEVSETNNGFVVRTNEGEEEDGASNDSFHDIGSSFIKRSDSAFTVSVDDSYLAVIGKTPLDEFQENLVTAYSRIAHEDSIVPSKRVFSLGEIALSTENDDLLVTACCIVNAAGESLPPFFILPRLKFKSSWLTKFPEGIGGTARVSGLMDDDAFVLALEHFQDVVKSDNRDNRVVLIMDDDEHHITVNSIDFCEQHGIEMVTLPPHYCPNLLPLERYVFPALKSYFRICVDKMEEDEVGMFHAISIFYKIYDFAFSGVNISNGFFDTGIYPLDDQLLVNEALLAGKGPPKCDIPGLEEEILLDFNDLPSPLNEEIENDDIMVENENDDDDDIDDGDGGKKNSPFTRVHDAAAEIVKYNIDSEDDEPIEVRNESLMIEFVSNYKYAINEVGKQAAGGIIEPKKIYCLEVFKMTVNAGKVSPKRVPHTSICCFTNAAGEYLPPFIVHPENCFNAEFLYHLPEGVTGDISDKGVITGEIFEKILQHFRDHVNASMECNNVLLLTRIEDKMTNLAMLDFLNENGIVMVTVPDVMAEPILPLERFIFSKFTKIFYDRYVRLLERKIEEPVTMVNVSHLAVDALKECLNSTAVTASFRSSGVWPLDASLFPRGSTSSDKFDFDDTSKVGMGYEKAKIAKPYVEIVGDIEYDEDDNDDEYDFQTVIEVPLSDEEDYDDVLLFYNDLEEFIDSRGKQMHGMTVEAGDVLAEKCIYVLGETTFTFIPSLQVTLFVFVNTVGTVLPPFIVYPSKFKAESFPSNSLGITGVSCENEGGGGGVINDQVFLSVLNHFCSCAIISAQDRLLLVMERKTEYVTDAVYAFLEDQDILLKTLPASDAKKYNPLQKPLIQPLEQQFVELTKKRKRKLRAECLYSIVKILEEKLVELIDTQKLVESFVKLGFNTIRPGVGQKSEEEGAEGGGGGGGGGGGLRVKMEEETKITKEVIQDDLEDFIIEEEIEETVESGEIVVTTDELCESRKLFCCCMCDNKFASAESIKEHEEKYKCRYCDLICCSECNRQKHEKEHVVNGKHICSNCRRECSSKAALIQHRRKHKSKILL